MAKLELENERAGEMGISPLLIDEGSRLLLDNASEGIAIVQDGVMKLVNPGLLKLIDYSEHELTSRPFTDFIHPDDRQMMAERYLKRVRGEEVPSAYSFRIIDRQGNTRWAEIKLLLFDLDGRPAVLAFLTDITERKGAEELSVALSTCSPIGIYIVGDRKFQFVNPQAERYFGYSKDEILGMDPLQLVVPGDRDRVRENAVKMLKGESSTAYEYRIITKSGETRWVTETVSSIQYQGKRAALGNFMDTTEQEEVKERLGQSLERLQRAIEGTVQAITLTVESRDPFTAGHQRRVAQLAGAIAQEMGFSSEEVRVIRIAGLVHDIGKICIPAEILSKPGALSEIESSLIKTHCQVGHDILKTVQFPWPIADIVHQHHERLDGSGYPLGLKDEDILLEAKILSVADVVEAMTSHRPYRPAPGLGKALEEISRNSSILYDPDVVSACSMIFAGRGFQFDEEPR